MATAVENTPKWFDAEFYLTNKLVMLQDAEPSANWTREMLNKTFVDNGFSNPYDHYLAYGDMETLNPNALFNANEYVAAKAAQLGSTWTVEMVRQTIKDAGMTLAEHYAKYGFMEGLNPSSDFDQNKYLDAKLELLLAEDPKGEWTIAKVRESFLANGITPLEHYMVYGKMEGLQDPKYDYSVNGNPIPHPGSDITLTTGTDTVGPKGAEGFVTSSRDDLISGVVSSISSRGTFNNTDVIDGAEGRDVLKLDMQGSFGGFKDGAGVKNVETIVLDNAGSYNFNAKGVEGAGQYVVNVANGKSTNLTNIDSAHTSVQLTSGLKGTLNIGYTDAALSGKTDNAHVYLNGVGEAQETQSEHFNLKVAAASTAQKAETVTLNSMGTGNFVKLGGNYDTVAVAGTADLDLVVDVKDLKNFDASAALGAVEVDLTKSTDLKSVLGGEGDDTVIVSSLKSGAVLNGGAGKDVLEFAAPAAGLAIKQQINGFETFHFTETSANVSATAKAVNHVIDMANITDLTTLVYTGATKATSTILYKDAFEVKNVELNEFTFQIEDTTTRDAVSKVDPLDDPGAMAKLVYQGAGTLNVQLVGDTGAGYAGLTSLTAKNATDLNVSSTNENTGFLTMGITANSVETMTIDSTGSAGIGVYTGGIRTVTADGSMRALQSIHIKGDAEVEFTANGTETALNSVDATDLKASLSLNLSEMVAGGKGVEINMGSGGTDGDLWDSGIIGTNKGDTINLGGGTETLHYTNVAQSIDSPNNGMDVISGFTLNDDKILIEKTLFTAASGSTALSTFSVLNKFEFDTNGNLPGTDGENVFKGEDANGSYTAAAFAYGHYNGSTYLYVNTFNSGSQGNYSYNGGKDMVIKVMGTVDFTIDDLTVSS